MKILLATAAALSLAFAPRPPAAAAEKLCGDYLEARTCDVWVGTCFANSETSEAGRQATLAWKFSSGAWKGVELKGAAAVLLIDARATLGDRYHSPLPVRNVLLLDERASDAQLVALREFVAAQLGDLSGNVIEERLVAIELETDCCEKKGCAKLVAGDVARIETRCLCDDDRVCGHEETFYPPLVRLSEKLPVFTLEHAVEGTLLGREWTDRETRSGFLGKFELEAPAAERTVDPDQVVAR